MTYNQSRGRTALYGPLALGAAVLFGGCATGSDLEQRMAQQVRPSVQSSIPVTKAKDRQNFELLRDIVLNQYSNPASREKARTEADALYLSPTNDPDRYRAVLVKNVDEKGQPIWGKTAVYLDDEPTSFSADGKARLYEHGNPGFAVPKENIPQEILQRMIFIRGSRLKDGSAANQDLFAVDTSLEGIRQRLIQKYSLPDKSAARARRA